MTKDEIMQLQPGRETDYIVALALGFITAPLDDDARDYALEYGWIHWYSTDERGAWEVVERVYKLGKSKDFLRGLYAQGIADLDVMVHHPPIVDCRAALLAVNS